MMGITQSNRIPLGYSEQGFSLALRELVCLMVVVFVSVFLSGRMIRFFGSKD
jgi:hypothetical protein